MDYAQAAYFHGDHCQHVAAWLEHHRLERIMGLHRLLSCGR